MTGYALDHQIPKDKFKTLFELSIAQPPTGFSKMLENLLVIAAIPAVQAKLAAAAASPPPDAVSSDLVYTLEQTAGGGIKVVFWYQHAPL
jgi:hypothetical protein